MSNLEYVPPEKLIIQLARPDSGVSWGFRLQGGSDFSTPLSVQSVQPNSVAECSGLRAGDGLLAINNFATDTMSHEDAKMEIIRSGNDISLLIQRGAVQIWKPKVTPMSELRPQELRQIQTATGDVITATQKTSLAHEPQESLKIGSGHNRSAKPFIPGGGGGQQAPRAPPQQQQYQQPPQQYQQQPQQYKQQQQQQQFQQQQQQKREPMSPVQAVPNVVHAQFNSPIGLYSAENLAHSYKTQTEGIQKEMSNLDLDERQLGQKMTGTYQVLDNEGDDQNENEAVVENTHGSTSEFQDRLDNSSNLHDTSEELNSTNTSSNGPSGFRSVRAPTTKPGSQQAPKQESMYCGGCGNMVSGVFVRIKGTPYHPQCFKCASCGLNLKQKGYFVVEGALYCEVHAKQKAEPPGPNMKAVPTYR